jgi:hypothetical protein
MKSIFLLTTTLFYILSTESVHAKPKQDDILGKWISEEKNLIVEVYKVGSEFTAKIIWFNDSDDKSQPMSIRRDFKNSDPKLRQRKIMGMEVLQGLHFNENKGEWQDGNIYDAKNGHDWNAKINLIENRQLKVRGYWHIEVIGQNLYFNKIS